MKHYHRALDSFGGNVKRQRKAKCLTQEKQAEIPNSIPASPAHRLSPIDFVAHRLSSNRLHVPRCRRMADRNQPLKKFGGNVRRHRDSLKLSREQLADQTEIHRTFISGIERGVRNPGLLSILRIVMVLGRDSASLFEGERA